MTLHSSMLDFAKKQGTIDGAEHADTIYHEQGIDELRACMAPGSDSWDSAARNAGAAEFSLHNEHLSDEVRNTYYEAYERSANAMANEILAEL